MEIIYVFTFLLALSLLNTVCSEPCPVKCHCILNSVRCSHQELVEIPKTSPEIQILDVRFNKIFKIAPGTFSHVHALRSLLLNDNRLQALRSGAFHGLHRLKYLYLYRNKIRHIDPDVFTGMHHLEQLFLHVNEIHQIEPDTFSNLPRLERLYLHNNLLRRILPGSFRGMPKLRKLRLDSNALICDCSILWFVRMLVDHSEMKVAATCHGPDHLTGTSLAAMKEHNLPCKHPLLSEEPQDVVVKFGEDAIFNCIATGEPSPKIVWLRDAAKLPSDESRYQIMDNGTLMVHEADENDTGMFECMAENPAGEVRSRQARMIVVASKPNHKDYIYFANLPRKQVAKYNQPYINFDCIVKGNPTPHISWLFNGERILLNERTSMRHNGSLFIQNIKDSDAGLYTCEAKNAYNTISASAALEVMIAPAFIDVPSDTTVTIGEKVEFICTARGVPEPAITWFRNTMVLPPSENIVISDNNTILTILETTKDDKGLYQCRAENSEGMSEISASLSVQDVEIIIPRILNKPDDTDTFKGTIVQLPCEVDSEPEAELEWRKDGSPVIPNGRISISLIGSLIINNVTLKDAGRYECLAFNEYGRDSASIFLTVKDHVLPGDEYVNIALTEATRDVDQAISNTINEIFNNKSRVDVHKLFRIVSYPDAPARELARAAEIYERTLDKVKGFIDSGLSPTSVEQFNYHNVLSPQQLEVIAKLSGCVAHREEKKCTDMCYHNKYRSIDGSCNNFAHPSWGTSLSGFRRILYPIYENGFSQPIGWNKDRKYNEFSLPSARLISTTLIKTEEITEDTVITHMAMQWGQWLDHDLDHALPPASIQSWDGIDCKKTCEYAAPCFPIDVPAGDPRVHNRRCIDFIRTSSVCGSGVTSVLFGTLQPREQINQLTSFIDASQVYGFELSVAEDLRDLTNDNGSLRVGASFTGRKPSLPTVGLNGMDCRRNLEESNRNCFVAGDIRANEQIGLAAMHTIWMREHNRIAALLKSMNPFWDGDKVYQEARKIVGAEMQVITYEHWLPVVLGPRISNDLGTYKGYKSSINPSVSNVFATAALRFGHSMINPILHRYDENFEPIPEGHLPLRHAFFSPWRLVDEGGVDPLFRGMFTTPAKLKTPTQNLNSELTEQLFYSAHAVALDLAAINIQRGRDHGIPPYTKWRQFCNMTEVNNFDDLAYEISNKNIREKLEELYGSVHNIDVWVGGILEDQIDGGKVGPLFKCLLIEQFQRLRDGDRFWYENPTVFKPEQLQELKKTSLARVLCDNGDNIDTIGENVFMLPEVQDGLMACEDLPTMDLRHWADCQSCEDAGIGSKRSRRDVNSGNGLIRLERQSDDLETMFNELKTTVEILKKRIDFLEGTYNNTKIGT